MTRSASPFFQDHEFDRFLLASIREEKNGMLLSVLSALARQDIDPWQEAARLSRLPRAIAIESLRATIAALPPGPPDPVDPRSIAKRLTALLPLANAAGRSQQKTAASVLATQADAVKYIVALVLMLGLLSFAASSRPPAPIEGAHAPIASAAVPPPLGY